MLSRHSSRSRRRKRSQSSLTNESSYSGSNTSKISMEQDLQRDIETNLVKIQKVAR